MAETFEREYELEGERGVLVMSQLMEGDVNCVVWDAALVLAKYLEFRCRSYPNWLVGKRVLELGAGLGCVGLVAACYGGHVTLTDQPKALPLLQYNVERNRTLVESFKSSVNISEMDWCQKFEGCTPVDVLLLADCVYYNESICPLVATMVQLSTPETEILLSQEDRSYSKIQASSWVAFCSEVQKYFTVSNIPVKEQHQEFSSPDIHLLRLKLFNVAKVKVTS